MSRMMRNTMLTAMMLGIAGIAGLDRFDSIRKPEPKSPTRRAEKQAAAQAKRERRNAKRAAKLQGGAL